MRDNLYETSSVCIQFSFSNRSLIPASATEIEVEKKSEAENRGMVGHGAPFIEPTGDCSIVEFLGDLWGLGYEVVSAKTQRRISETNRRYHMVRFHLLQKEMIEKVVGSKNAAALKSDLSRLCSEALWRVRAYINPADDGSRFLSINLEARKPLYHPDGSLLAVWERDIDGNKIGESPIPLTASNFLIVRVDGTIHLRTESNVVSPQTA